MAFEMLRHLATVGTVGEFRLSGEMHLSKMAAGLTKIAVAASFLPDPNIRGYLIAQPP